MLNWVGVLSSYHLIALSVVLVVFIGGPGSLFEPRLGSMIKNDEYLFFDFDCYWEGGLYQENSGIGSMCAAVNGAFNTLGVAGLICELGCVYIAADVT